MSTTQHPAILRLHALFDAYGSNDYIGEPVSQAEHSFQAGYFAAKDGASTEVVIASFLHDIGHMLGLEANMEMRMGNCGIVNHELIGGNFLRKCGFPENVAFLVQNHVQAKRYLCFSQPEYFNQLSDASRTTLGYQGGPMNAEEAAAFEANPNHKYILRMRSYDEAAKVSDFPVNLLPTWQDYDPLLEQLLSSSSPITAGCYLLSEAQLQSYHENSYLKISNLLSFAGVSQGDLATWCEEVAAFPSPAPANTWLSHHELNADGTKQLCRSENFLDYHERFSWLAREIVKGCTAQLFASESALFKEKINYKLPGGAGFAAHQDSPAYIGLASDHISVMVAIDAADEGNGCLQVAGGEWIVGQVKLDPVTGIITNEEESAMEFKLIPCQAGDVLFFSGYLPHRSGPNLSTRPRRAMYLTYNPLSQGDHRAAYYAAKHAKANGFDSKNTLSFQGDFQGIVVD